MRLKHTNEHVDYDGHCDDWDDNTHAGTYDDACTICNVEFEDGDEFLELTCTHVLHT